ncbi:retrovirus-related pol polyprotein from transposon TNT 1-94 [Tanacetum coccineum]
MTETRTQSGEQSINLNTIVGDTDEDEVQEIRPYGKDKVRAAARKNKGSKSTGSSNVNEDALAKLMVTEMTAQEKEERLAFLDIKRREVACRERDLEQQDMRMTNTQTPPPATTVVIPTGALATNTVANHAEKPEKFNAVYRLPVTCISSTGTHYAPESAKANMVEHVGSSSRSNPKGKGKDKRKNDKKSKGKSEYLAPKARIVKQKFQGICYNYEQHCAKLVGTNHGGWWIDTGATHHVCADKSMFHSFRAVDNGQKLYMTNSATVDIKGEGDVVLKMTSKKELKLTNVLYVLKICKNLVFGWLLNKFDFRLVFESDKFVLSKNQVYVGKGYAMNGMFKLNVMVVKNEINKMNSSAYLIESSNVWHARLGHVNFNSLRRLIKFNSIPNCHIDSKYKCETCVEAKLTRTSFKSVKRTTEPLDMVHTDICDLKSLPTKGGNKYFIMFIDDCTKYCYVYLLKSKDEAIDKFVLYKNEVENQLGKKIKVVRSDRGGEYVSPFAELCAQHGIRHEFTAPYSPQQNGIAERKNRTLKEMVTAMLISSGMSQDMWGEAILTATYLLNKIPRKEKEETPYELWMGRKPSYQYLRVWGCLAKVVVPTPKAQKIGPKSVDCIFIGYAKNSSAYRFIVHESKNPDIQKNTVMESRNASFFEHIFPCLSKETGSSARLEMKSVQR